MRYTTIIDISESPILYKNVNTRLLYLHLCLKCGYDDDNRDNYNGSLRLLARETGLTLSAVRNSLKQLKNYNLITVTEFGTLKVRKYLTKKEITPRAKAEKEQQRLTQRQKEIQYKKEESERAEKQRREFEEYRSKLEREGKTPFMEYYESLIKKYNDGDTTVIPALKRGREHYEDDKKFMEEKKSGK